MRKLDFASTHKGYYLYDLFEWKAGDDHTKLGEHANPDMYENTKSRFEGLDFVRLVKGRVPESFAQGFPDKIAFAHIDMNSAPPEAGALARILPKLSAGGVVVLDDYGWWGYGEQKVALDPIAQAHGVEILELPTGQGLIIKS